MRIKTPEFWRRKNIKSYSLLPLSFVYLWVKFLIHLISRPKSLGRTTITVGNLTSGGAGKTPVVLEVSRMLNQHGMKVAILAKGYGGKVSQAAKVQKEDKACDVGDEPLLMSKYFATYISKSRKKAAPLIRNSNSDIVLMDDGYQNPTIHHDIRLLVINGAYGFGNSMVLPAGPLRERVSGGVRKADAVIILGKCGVDLMARIKSLNKNIFHANKVPVTNLDKTKKYYAFSGLGINEKFFHFLTEKGYQVMCKKEFPDHYLYNRKDIEEVISEAADNGLVPITTEKDYVKIDSDLQKKIEVMKIRVSFEQEEDFYKLLMAKI